jgi:hypothetical protein
LPAALAKVATPSPDRRRYLTGTSALPVVVDGIAYITPTASQEGTHHMAAHANEAAYRAAIQSTTDTLAAISGSNEARVALDKLGELVAAVRNAKAWNASAELTPSV